MDEIKNIHTFLNYLTALHILYDVTDLNILLLPYHIATWKQSMSPESEGL